MNLFLSFLIFVFHYFDTNVSAAQLNSFYGKCTAYLTYSDCINCCDIVGSLRFVTNCLVYRSSDDPFMLYAALYFGQKTYIVTKDHYRNHSYLLGPELANRLKVWQRQRQITFLGNRYTRKLRFQVSLVVPKTERFLIRVVKIGFFCNLYTSGLPEMGT